MKDTKNLVTGYEYWARAKGVWITDSRKSYYQHPITPDKCVKQDPLKTIEACKKKVDRQLKKLKDDSKR